MEDSWKTAFGKDYPAGFKFEEADTWTKEQWLTLCRADIVIARRLALMVEISKRNLQTAGLSITNNSPFAEDLNKASVMAIYAELADPEESVRRLKEILPTPTK